MSPEPVMPDERGERAIDAIVEEIAGKFLKWRDPHAVDEIRAILRKHHSVSRQDEEPVAWMVEALWLGAWEPAPSRQAYISPWLADAALSDLIRRESERGCPPAVARIVPLGVLRSGGPGEP